MARYGSIIEICIYLNGLNLSLQGTAVTPFIVEDKVVPMIMKSDL
jgi:hypothetical protein